MRLLLPLIAMACLAAGFAFGALNPQPVAIDLFGLGFELGLGLALLAAALAGALLAAACLWLFVLWPLRRRLRRFAAEHAPRVDGGSA